ncbi:MAG: alpha/beta hydrolase [Pelatocladus maniniholoensis HA4357-MV3]|uniref:Alpha/beta hydrolase n=1 Tax=Pelatocladus maniniholoensis HA4357-MV3 TaxID=1117104 RepID=A0A9E3LVP9_9NOST|nr:alpha/beta hydrolase [Pelatocladus maniniholoensis HA4357-MV3]
MKQFLYQNLLPLFSVSAIALQTFTVAAAKSTTPSSVKCSDTYLPVALSPNELPQYKIYGELCSKLPIEGRTVQVLVSGLTYNHNYWDFPYQQKRYSYVNAMTRAGYATFNIDRIGLGKSSRPPVDQVNLQSNTYVLAQINQALRNGSIEGVRFDRIINVGHSFGSLGPVVNVASQYGGVDGIILTGFLHNLNIEYAQFALNSFYSAQLDPNFSGQNIPDDYLTTIPETRAELFYNQLNVDPQVIALDEQLKDTTTGSEIYSQIDAVLSNTSKNIKVPVLLVIGQQDNPFCTQNICDSAESVAAFEAPYFSPEAKLQIYVLPNAGHSINLELNAPLWYKVARQWSDRFVGKGSRSPDEQSETEEFDDSEQNNCLVTCEVKK